MYTAAYENPIQCTRGPEVWKKFDGEKMEPPVFRRRPGRLAKNRRKSKGEVRKLGNNGAFLSRQGQVQHCSHCRSEAHTINRCPTRWTEPPTKKPKNTNKGRKDGNVAAAQSAGRKRKTTTSSQPAPAQVSFSQPPPTPVSFSQPS